MSRIHRRNPRHGRRRAERSRLWLRSLDEERRRVVALVTQAIRAPKSIAGLSFDEAAARHGVTLPPMLPGGGPA